MFQKLYDMLICPICKSRKLNLKDTKIRREEYWGGDIVCQHCNRVFPVKYGIPCFLSQEQLAVLEDGYFKLWLKQMKNIEDDIIDEDLETFKNTFKEKDKIVIIDQDAERLLWEKKLYLDNQELGEILGDKNQSKWSIAKDNIKIRNDHAFRVISNKENFFSEKMVLNIGPGIDDNLITRLEAQSATVINYDINIDPLIQLSLDNPRDCVCSDLKSLPFDEHSFDSLFCFHVIHHAHSIEQSLSEAIRVLKPDGGIFILEINYNHLFSLIGKLLSRKAKKIVRKLVRKHVDTDKRLFQPSPYEKIIKSRKLIHTMSKAGFTDITRKTVTHAPFILPDHLADCWNLLGFKFPLIFDPFGLEYLFVGKKSDA